MYILSKSKINIKHFHLKITIFTAINKRSILHRPVSVMVWSGSLSAYVVTFFFSCLVFLNEPRLENLFPGFPTRSDKNQIVKPQ